MGAQEAGFAVISWSFGEGLDRKEGKLWLLHTDCTSVWCHHAGLGGIFRVACSLFTVDIFTSTPN